MLLCESLNLWALPVGRGVQRERRGQGRAPLASAALGWERQFPLEGLRSARGAALCRAPLAFYVFCVYLWI